MIDPRAVVSSAADLADDVQVGPFAVIEADVVVGAGSRVGAHATLCSGTRLGRDNVVHMGAVLGNEPQDLAYRGAPTFLAIGDRNTFREGCQVHRGSSPGSTTTVGNDCYFMTNSHVAHNCAIDDGAILATGAVLGGHAHIGERAFVSGTALVHQYVRVGRLTMLQGGCAVSRDVPPFLIAARPTNLVAGVNAIGLKRAGFDRPQIAALRRAYRVLFGHRVNLRRARERLLELEAVRGGPTAEVAELLEFIEQSRRGVCFGTRSAVTLAREPGDGEGA